MRGSTSTGGRRHIPALDGLRGLAVAGVVAYHLGYLRGGFLGVDLFFVLSGYLITSLLVDEWRRRGRIDMPAFWGRRAKRLLPALFLVLVGVALYAAWAAPSVDKASIRGDGIAALLYISNWHQITAGISYFGRSQSVSPLQHLWSLAIEEQFYVAWPIVAIVVMGARRRRGPGAVAEPDERRTNRALLRLLLVSLGLAVASAAWMAHLYDPAGSPNRIYYGTDTRATAILLGAALAVAIHRWGHRLDGGPATIALHFLAIAGAGVLIVVWGVADGNDAWLYRGGMAGGEVAACIVIAALVTPTVSGLGLLLSWRPLQGLGRISYGVYLWHWPVIVYLTADRLGFGGLGLNAVRVALTWGLALASASLVEMPIRRGTFSGRVVLGAAASAAVVCLVLVLVTTLTAPSPFAKEIAAEKAHPGRLLVATDPVDPPPVARASTPAKPAGPTVTLVVGDSGAYYLGQGMDREGPAFHRQVIDRGTVGCGIARADGRLLLATGQILRDPDGCGDYISRWIGYLNTYHPQRVVLVLADVGGGDRYLDGAWRDDCDPDWSTYFQAQATEAMAVLHADGAKVSVTTIPDIATRQPASAARLTDCRNDNLIAAARTTHSQVVDLRHWACPTPDTCKTRIDGIHVRPDDVHYLGAGADIAAKWIFSKIKD